MALHLIVQKIRDLLESRQIKFDYFEHEPVRTSEEASKIRSGYTIKQGAKALVVKLNLRGGEEKFVMLIVPGDARFDSKKVKKLFDAREVRFATEKEIEDISGGVQVGGVPPFGSLFGLQTYIDPQVGRNERIVFNAGDRRVSVAVAFADYKSIEDPIVAELI